MFAVIRTGGKQYKVAKNDEITIEKLAASEGDVVRFDDVLMLSGEPGGVTLGSPTIDDAAVTAEVMLQMRGEKVYTFKKRRRKHSSARLKGHRQSLTVVKITDIFPTGASNIDLSAMRAAVVDDVEPELDQEPDADGGDDAAARPSNLLDAPEGEPDDLTRISGVGDGLHEKLNANGVYHFWQIAEWGPAEVAYINDQLSFKGRIERDEWIQQAKRLAAEADEE